MSIHNSVLVCLFISVQCMYMYEIWPTLMIRLHSWTNILPWINITEYAYLLLQCRNVAFFLKWEERQTDIKILIGKKKKRRGVVSTISIILYFFLYTNVKIMNFHFISNTFSYCYRKVEKPYYFKNFFHIVVCKCENKVNLL